MSGQHGANAVFPAMGDSVPTTEHARWMMDLALDTAWKPGSVLITIAQVLLPVQTFDIGFKMMFLLPSEWRLGSVDSPQ